MTMFRQIATPLALSPCGRGRSPVRGGGRGVGGASRRSAAHPSPNPLPQGERAPIRRSLVLFALLALAACHVVKSDKPQAETATYGAGDNWPNPGGDWAGSHYSRLTDINAQNVAEEVNGRE